MPTTLSKNPLPCSALNAHCARTEPALRTFLESLCARPQTHARFFNTLSLLEHIGSRKIMASQSKDGLEGEVLQHLAEEDGHLNEMGRALRQADPFAESRIERFTAIECGLFDRLLTQLKLAAA